MLATTRKASRAVPSLAALRICHTPAAVIVRLKIRQYGTAVELPVPNKRKVWGSADEAVNDVKSGDVLLSGGE